MGDCYSLLLGFSLSLKIPNKNKEKYKRRRGKMILENGKEGEKKESRRTRQKMISVNSSGERDAEGPEFGMSRRKRL